MMETSKVENNERPKTRQRRIEAPIMDAAKTTYEERLRLADSIDDYKGFFSQPHCKLLVDEALKGTREGSEKLEFIVALAHRCKTGLVSAKQLAQQVEEAYSLRPVRHEGEEETEEWVGEGDDDEDDKEEEDEDQDEEEDEEEDKVLEVDAEVKDLFETHERGFCAKNRWPSDCASLVFPGEGYWLDAHHIKLFRPSTFEDFATATPKPMPVYIDGNPWSDKKPKRYFTSQQRNYHLCKRVAVSFNGKIYRATDAEIAAALNKTEGAPDVDAATYVKLAQETRRCHEIERALIPGKIMQNDQPKRRRVQVAM